MSDKVQVPGRIRWYFALFYVGIGILLGHFADSAIAGILLFAACVFLALGMVAATALGALLGRQMEKDEAKKRAAKEAGGGQ